MNPTDTTVPRSSLYRVTYCDCPAKSVVVASTSAYCAAKLACAALGIPLDSKGLLSDYPRPGSYTPALVSPKCGELAVVKLPREKP